MPLSVGNGLPAWITWCMIWEMLQKEGRKEMFYLMMHSTHFIYGYMASDIWLSLKDHSDSEKGNPLPPHRELFQQGFFYMHHPTDRIAHTTAFVTPVMEHWLEREIAQWVHPMKDRSDDPSHHDGTLLPQSYISLPTATEADRNCAGGSRGHNGSYQKWFSYLMHIGYILSRMKKCFFSFREF